MLRLSMKLALLQRWSLVQYREQDNSESDLLSEIGVSSNRTKLSSLLKRAFDNSAVVLIV